MIYNTLYDHIRLSFLEGEHHFHNLMQINIIHVDAIYNKQYYVAQQLLYNFNERETG